MHPIRHIAFANELSLICERLGLDVPPAAPRASRSPRTATASSPTRAAARRAAGERPAFLPPDTP